MAISVGGLASGLDTESIISQLMAIEQRPIILLQQDEAFYQSKISALGTLTGALSTFQSAAVSLKDADSFISFNASSGNPDVLDVSASEDASPGNYQVTVTALAQAQQVRSASFNASDQVVGTGTLTIQVGTGTAVDIEIDSDHQTLSGIATAINEADTDVTAGVINDGNGNYYLTLASQETGLSNTINFSLQDDDANNDDASGLSSLYTDPVGHTVTETQAAGNAQLTVNGIVVERAGNTIADLVEGLTFTLNQKDPGNPFIVSVSENLTSVTSKVQAFVDQYNNLVDVLDEVQNYNAQTGETGTLLGDSTTRQLHSRIQNLLYTQVEGVASDVNGLSRLGVELERNGTLSFDSSTLTAAFEENREEVINFFSQDEIGNKGIAIQFDDLLDSYLSSTTGLIAAKEDGLQSSIEGIRDQIERIDFRLSKKEETIRAQFQALEILLSNFQTTSGALTQQLATLANLNSQISTE